MSNLIQVEFPIEFTAKDVKNFIKKANKEGNQYGGINGNDKELYDTLKRNHSFYVTLWSDGAIGWGALDSGNVDKDITLKEYLDETTYYVSKEILDKLNDLRYDFKDESIPFYSLVNGMGRDDALEFVHKLDDDEDKPALLYVLGDDSITFETLQEDFVLAKQIDDETIYYAKRYDVDTFTNDPKRAEHYDNIIDAIEAASNKDFTPVAL